MIRSPSRGDPGNLFPVGLALFLLSCQGEKAAPPVVEYASCWEVSLPGPVCTRWPSEEPGLKLWVKHEPGEEVEIRAGDQRLAVTGTDVSGGSYFKISIPEDAFRITVSLISPDGRRSPGWSLELGPRPPEWQSDGTLGDAEKRERLRRAASPREQGFILRAIALMESDQGRKEKLLQQGIALDYAEKNLRGETEKIGWLARLYLEQGRFSAARKVLSGAELPPKAPAEARYWIAFYQGVLAQRVGDYRAALEHIRGAVELAKRVGLSSYRFDAEQVLANIHQSLGQSKEASKLFARLREEADPDKKTSCEFGILLTNHAWSQLLARQAEEDFGDPTPTLEEARNIYDNGGCQAGLRLNARLNLALAHLQENRPRQARQALQEARPFFSQANLEKHLWRLDIEGRILIAEGRLEPALRRYDELAETAEDAGSPDGRFRALLGRAQARLALSQPAKAIESLAQADDLLDQQIWRIPVHEGRDTFLAQKGTEAIRRYLDLLLDDGQTERAFEVARRSRSRLLRQLELNRLTRLSPERQAEWDQALSRYLTLRNEIDGQSGEKWQVPKAQREAAAAGWSARIEEARRELDRAVSDLGNLTGAAGRELSPPGPGEVILLYHPLPEGWVGFAAHAGGIAVERFEFPGSPLLEPFRSVIRAANRVRVLPYGPLWEIDFAALPFDGRPLLARHTVVYSLDLPPPSSAPAGSHLALLVSDPKGNLPAARKEADMVFHTIQGWGSAWNLERLRFDAQAKTVRERLRTAHLFHYAGHGLFEGDAGWESVLELADDSTLTVGDILALPRAPEWVVLSACEGARSSERAPGTGVGLAQAFLVAGSRGVIAAHRPVPDSTARELMRELYREWRPGADLARELRRAQLAYLQRHPASDDWASFRLLTP